MSKRKFLIGLVVAILVVAVGALAETSLRTEPDRKEAGSASETIRAEVVRIVDGDTLTAKIKQEENNFGIGGDTVEVRFIGIDAPEINWEDDTDECFGFAAREYLDELLQGREVRLQPDSTQPIRDEYRRYLFYVHSDEKNINRQLLQGGYARELTVGGGYSKQDSFKKAATLAQRNNRGLWDECE